MVFKENISHQLDAVSGVKAHSIIFKGNQPSEPYAYFLAYHSTNGNILDPEIYPRPSKRFLFWSLLFRSNSIHSNFSDGDIYICGFSEECSQNLPDSGNAVTINESNCERLRQIVVEVASTLKDLPVETQQACYLPQSNDGHPLIGRLYGLNNVYIATVILIMRKTK